MTQRETVLRLLQRAGRDGLCVSDIDQDLAYCLRNRVSELVALGYGITAERCQRHRHYGRVARYHLTPTAVDGSHGGRPAESAAAPVAAGAVARAAGSLEPEPAAQTQELFPPPFERWLGHGR